MLLQILGTLEGLAAELALVGLQGNVDANVRGNVVTLDGGGAARVPLAGEAEVVGALAANMAFAEMFLADIRDTVQIQDQITYVESLGRDKLEVARVPLADEVIISSDGGAGRGGSAGAGGLRGRTGGTGRRSRGGRLG